MSIVAATPDIDPAAERMVTLGLTTRQAEVFLYLFNETATNGYQPSLQQMMDRFGFTGPNGIGCHLLALRRKGWLASGSGRKSRALTFARIPDGSPFLGFRLAGWAHEFSMHDRETALMLVDRGLTGRQSEVYLFFLAGTLDAGYQPTNRDACDRFGVTTNAIGDVLRAVARRNWIGMSERGSRSLRFLKNPDGGRFRGFESLRLIDTTGRPTA